VEKETLEYVNNNFDEAMEKVAKEVDLSLEETKELYAWYDFSLGKDSLQILALLALFYLNILLIFECLIDIALLVLQLDIVCSFYL
ncbi:hypothetical protein ACTPEM_24960, partial [Clostridioides difficile]